MKLGEAIKWALPEKIAKEELPVFDVEYERCADRGCAPASEGCMYADCMQ